MKKYPTITIRIDDQTLQRINQMAQGFNHSRSRVIKDLLAFAMSLETANCERCSKTRKTKLTR